MGAWGHSYFENDDAADFAGDLADNPSWETVRGALRSVAQSGDDDYVEAPDACIAIAAAATVAIAANKLKLRPEDESYATGALKLRSPPQELFTLALGAIGRVRRPASELLDLWSEGDASIWCARLDELEAALRQ